MDESSETPFDQSVRRFPKTEDVEELIDSPAGPMARMRLMGEQGRREFVSIRTPSMTARLAVTHIPILHAVWAVWGRKRLQGDDPGVTISEIVEQAQVTVSRATSVVASLLRNKALRSVVSTVGWMGNRALYYPTERGRELIRMSAVLPAGSVVQVGKTSKAFKSRAKSEPANFFQYAALRRGGPLRA